MVIPKELTGTAMKTADLNAFILNLFQLLAKLFGLFGGLIPLTPPPSHFVAATSLISSIAFTTTSPGRCMRRIC